jgi:ATP-dependent RNA helicase RhlE
MSTESAAPRAGADGIAIAFCSPDERGNLRDIERTTRQKIAVTPLPQGFAQAAEALKRLKPAPAQCIERPATKAHRRADGQHRDHRNDRQQRHPVRAEGHPAHRPEGGQPKRKFRGRRRFGSSRVA